MAAPQFTPSGLSDLTRTLALVDAADTNIRRRFLQLIAEARGLQSLEQIIVLVNQGRMFEALRLIEDVGPGLNEAITTAYIAAGASVAQALRGSGAAPLIRFDTLASRGVFALQESNARLVRELTRQQSSALSLALQEGVRAGLRPDQIARAVRGSIGLTASQAQSVANYRRSLMNLDSTALTRELRDRRFDGTVRGALVTNTPLKASQIDNMVARYEAKLLDYRSRVIAGSEALAAVNLGEAQMWDQAVARGLNPREVVQTWHTTMDGRQRDSHGSMDGQEQPLGQPFISGSGVRLRYPGDSSAPAKEVVSCRCVVTRRFLAPPL